MKIMFHYINKEKNNSPTIVANRIKELIKNEKFEFSELNQNISASHLINFKLISNLKRQIKKEKPDVVVLSGIASGFNAAIACRRCHVKKIVLITHGIESLNPDRSLIKRLIFKYIVEPLTIILSTDIQCNSRFVYDLWSIGLFARKKRHLIYNPLPCINYDLLDNKTKKNNKDFVIVSASRIIKNKGYDILSDAIKKLSNYNIKFIIVGDGNYLQQMKTDLKNNKNVSFLGKVDNVELLNVIKNANLFVLPSKLYETYGLVYVESGILKIPSVCGNRGAVKEIVNNTNGFVLDKYDSDELTKIILYAYSNRNELKQKGKKIYVDVMKINSDEIIFNELFDLYNN